MDLKQLEAFVHVIIEGSFSKAAKKLYLTQPTISAHIGALERELDCQLILRKPKEALPTEAGEDLYGYAVQMLDLRSRALSQLRGRAVDLRGVISIAASSIPHQYVLPGIMTAFRGQYPDITFSVLSFDSAGVVDAVSRGRADVGMTGTLLSSSGCIFMPFLDDELVVVTPNTGPYTAANADGFALTDLKKLPFVIREPGSGTRKETEIFLAANGLTLDDFNIIAQLDDPDAIKHAVGQGMGISVMSRLAAADHEEFGRIRTFSLGGKGLHRKLYLVRQKTGSPSPAAEAFLTFVQAYGAAPAST